VAKDVIKLIPGHAMTVIYRSLRANPKDKDTQYYTSITNKSAGRVEFQKFQKWIQTDLHSEIMLDYKGQLDWIRSAFEECNDYDVKVMGLAVIKLFENLYSREPPRVDGTHQMTHPVWLAYTMGKKLRLQADVILAALLHDAGETRLVALDHHPLTFKILARECGPENERQMEVLESVWWMIERMTYTPLPEVNGYSPEKLLKRALDENSWRAFRDLETQELLSPIKHNYNKDYVHIQIHQSDCPELILMKCFDCYFNVYTAKYLNKIGKIYSHVRKPPIHAEAAAKMAYWAGEPIRRGLTQLWKELERRGIGPQHLPESYSRYNNLFIKTPDQLEYEKEGFDRTNPRDRYDETRSWCRTTPRIFTSYNGYHFLAEGKEHRPLTIELPTIIGSEIDGPFGEPDMTRAERKMKADFKKRGIHIEMQDSLLGTVLGNEFDIWDVIPSKKMRGDGNRLSGLRESTDPRDFKRAADLSVKINIDYLDLINEVQEVIHGVYIEEFIPILNRLREENLR
jgi:hypothetical protein